MEGTRNPLENALVLSVQLSKFGTSRKVRDDMISEDGDVEKKPITTEAQKKRIKVSKKIYEGNATKQIDELFSQIKSHLKQYTIVGAMFKNGLYLTPEDHVSRTENFMIRCIEDLELLKWQVGEEYDSVIRQFSEELGPLFDASNYPGSDKVKSSYSIDYEWLSINVPAALERIDRDAHRRANERAEVRVQAAAERVEQVLLAAMQDLVSHLVERLTDIDDGKHKKFASNMVDKAREFFETFQSRNLTGAESLNNIAEQGLSLLQGVDLDSLKDQASMRERVRNGFESIKSNMSAMIQVAPRRAMDLSDGDDDDPVAPSPTVTNDRVNESGSPDVQVEIDAVHQADSEAEVATVSAVTDDLSVEVENTGYQPEFTLF